MLVTLVLAGFQSDIQLEHRPTVWRVKDLLPATPSSPPYELGWSYMQPLGDPDGDGIHSSFAMGGELNAASHTIGRRRFADHWMRDEVRHLSFDILSPLYFRFPFSQSYLAPFFTLLRAPDGIRAIIVDSDYSPIVTVRDWATGQPRGYFAPPPPPQPNWPPFVFFDSFRTAGDVDSDGYDDIFFEALNGASVVGLIDGRTFQTLWMHGEYPYVSHTPVTFVSQGGPFDLTGDGMNDLIHGTTVFDLNNPGQYLYVLVALSGADGTVLWRHESAWLNGGASIWGEDLNGDQVPDIIATDNDDWFALDGASGTVLWTFPKSDLDAFFNPGFLAFDAHYTGLTIQPSQYPGGPRAYIPVDILYPGVQGRRRPIVEVVARTGEVIGQTGLPEDIQPWSSDLLNAKSLRMSTLISSVGDIDRDGLCEIAHGLFSPSWDIPGTVGFPIQTVLMSPETLSLPEHSPADGIVVSDLWIPSGAGLQFRLIASSVFDGSGGERVDGWKTHLGASPLLASTMAQPAAAGVLDSAGKAQFLVDLAQLPLTFGEIVTWKAVILRAGSATEVHTLSTLAQTEIVP